VRKEVATALTEYVPVRGILGGMRLLLRLRHKAEKQADLIDLQILVSGLKYKESEFTRQKKIRC
jgi:hypothetical protein